MNGPGIGDETGLVGKLLVLWLLVAALVVVAAVDAASILFARIRIADVAQDAAVTGATTIAEGGGRRAAKRAVLGTIADRDDDAVPEEITISEHGVVTVTVLDHAGTILVGRFGLFEELGAVKATDSSGPPNG